MPKNYSKNTLSTLDTVPASSLKAGSVDSSGRYLTGTSTLFKSDKSIVEGDWIFSPVEKEARRIERIISDTSIYLEESFSNDLAAEDLRVTKASRAREISLFNGGGSDTTIDGQLLSNNEGVVFAEENWYGGSQRDFPDPIVVDGLTSSVNFLIVY